MLLLGGCNDKSIDGDDPPRVIPYIQYLSTSHVDDYVYFFFGGDTVVSQGIYRYDMVARKSPEIVVTDAIAGAVSPCGDELAYLTFYGDLRLLDLTSHDSVCPDSSVLVDTGPSGGHVSVRWRGCDTILFTGDPGSGWGVYQVDVNTEIINLIQAACRDGSASLDGESIAYTTDLLHAPSPLLLLHEGNDIDTLIDFDSLPGQSTVRNPMISWSGEYIGYVRRWSSSDGGAPFIHYDSEIVNTSTRERGTVAEQALYPTWVRDGRILYVSIDTAHFRELWCTNVRGSNHEQILTYDDFYQK
ncbi:MAG: hypothetical protein GF341_12540 [candidate division Zixibacteria bacterium]|nr:hypothetical protein [candidate division Zixibacteria bacterium]